MDAKEYCNTYNVFQRVGKPSRRDDMPLNPQVILQDFDKWGINFIRPINPPVRISRVRYIIKTTKYLTQWVETMPVMVCSVETIANFLFENIVT
jgi:hypothetical protein